MPIKGLTDRGVAFPQIGNIRKGGKKVQIVDKATGKGRVDENGKPILMQGPDLQYFRVEFDERETAAIAKFNALYPIGQPSSITVILPFDEIERVWDPWREAYAAGALLHRCDGEFVNYAINPASGEIVVRNGLDANGQRVKCNLQNDPDKRKRCKPTGRLSVIIPELERLAYLVVHTTSIHDILNISNQLAAIRDMNGGHIAGIPLVLRRRPVEISTPSGTDGQRARRVKWLISIEADPEWVGRKINSMKISALPAGESPRILEAPKQVGPEWSEVGDDEDDDDTIEGELIPPTKEEKKPKTESPKTESAKASLKQATLRCDFSRFNALADAFAKSHPRYASKDGTLDRFHFLKAAAAEGYTTITDENMKAVFDQVAQRHALEQADSK